MRFNNAEFMPDVSGYDQGPVVLDKYSVLGPPEFEEFDPDSDSEESIVEAIHKEAFEDVNNPKYIDYRQPSGYHCMDYDATQPGVQLPGGFTETVLFANYINPGRDARPMSEEYSRVTSEMLEWGITSFHHNKCAAAKHKRDALGENFVHEVEAREFTYAVLDELDLTSPRTDRNIQEAIFTGAEAASDVSLWDVDFEREKGTEISKNLGAPYEVLDKSGRSVPVGLRIDTSPHLFNAALFRREHAHGGLELGVYSVTLGAFRDELLRIGVKKKAVARMVMAAALFTHGLAKHVGDEYLRAAVVKTRRGY
jgi:hypothetical protein